MKMFIASSANIKKIFSAIWSNSGSQHPSEQNTIDTNSSLFYWFVPKFAWHCKLYTYFCSFIPALCFVKLFKYFLVYNLNRQLIYLIAKFTVLLIYIFIYILRFYNVYVLSLRNMQALIRLNKLFRINWSLTLSFLIHDFCTHHISLVWLVGTCYFWISCNKSNRIKSNQIGAN